MRHYELRTPSGDLASAFCFTFYPDAVEHRRVMKARSAVVVEVVTERREIVVYPR